jgi:hypothetical protein
MTNEPEPPSCRYCPHVAERHVQTDEAVYCEVCRMDCCECDDIDDDSWIGDWHADTGA